MGLLSFVRYRRQVLFCHHLYVAITVSFEIDTAVFTIVDIEDIVVFVLLVIAAIKPTEFSSWLRRWILNPP